ncbi:MAG: O-antigen ligase family protein [Parcubacteria group bacterium]|nr:O-antigen ligase family protein [Parcubacteria group bacterium]
MSQINWLKIFDPKKLLLLTGACLAIYLLSFLGYILPFLNYLFFGAILIATFYFTRQKLEYGVYILIAELIIGVKGYLFSLNLGGFVLSLRIAIFCIVMLVWLLSKNKDKFKFFGSRYFRLYLLLTIALLVGVITALINGNSIKNIFFDINGYFYLALIVVLFCALKSKKTLRQALQIVIAGSIAISLFTFYCIGEFTIFHQESRPDMAEAISTEQTIEEEEEAGTKISHSITAKEEISKMSLTRDFANQKPPLYRWVTDTSVGEISYLAGPFFRFFTPSQLYCLIGLAITLTFLLREKVTKKKTLFLSTIVALNLAALIIGFSRSLWIGLLAVFLFLLFNLPRKKSAQIILYAIGVASIIIILTGTLLPSVYDLVEQRVTSIIHPTEERSGANRFNLLEPVFAKIGEHPLVGSGFGTTIEYESVVLEKYGTLRVFAFEWSYLDTMIEIGLIGLLIYLLLILKVFRTGYSKGIAPADKILLVGLLAALFGIVITNTTTPYLNHPLGIGFLLLTMTTIAISSSPQPNDSKKS